MPCQRSRSGVFLFVRQAGRQADRKMSTRKHTGRTQKYRRSQSHALSGQLACKSRKLKRATKRKNRKLSRKARSGPTKRMTEENRQIRTQRRTDNTGEHAHGHRLMILGEKELIERRLGGGTKSMDGQTEERIEVGTDEYLLRERSARHFTEDDNISLERRNTTYTIEFFLSPSTDKFLGREPNLKWKSSLTCSAFATTHQTQPLE